MSGKQARAARTRKIAKRNTRLLREILAERAIRIATDALRRLADIKHAREKAR
jgi:hypothetical protein